MRLNNIDNRMRLNRHLLDILDWTDIKNTTYVVLRYKNEFNVMPNIRNFLLIEEQHTRTLFSQNYVKNYYPPQLSVS
jgi:hypothetical protein